MPRLSRSDLQPGFTLVEVLVAIFLLTIALLAIEGSAAVTLRELADGQRETLATRLAERQRERAFADPCAASSGIDSANGVGAIWTAIPTGQRIRLGQHTSFDTRRGTRLQSYDAVGRCR
ncbi:MAG: type IV pilus modification PilV family protein [Gemmatimonadaceae bacterium]